MKLEKKLAKRTCRWILKNINKLNGITRYEDKIVIHHAGIEIVIGKVETIVNEHAVVGFFVDVAEWGYHYYMETMGWEFSMHGRRIQELGAQAVLFQLAATTGTE